MGFPMSASQDASVEYNQLKIKICDFFHLDAFGCFLTVVRIMIHFTIFKALCHSWLLLKIEIYFQLRWAAQGVKLSLHAYVRMCITLFFFLKASQRHSSDPRATNICIYTFISPHPLWYPQIQEQKQKRLIQVGYPCLKTRTGMNDRTYSANVMEYSWVASVWMHLADKIISEVTEMLPWIQQSW